MDADFDPVEMIAEDVVMALMTAGYRPIVYGFNSTALLNLARFVRTVSIFLAPVCETIAGQVMFQLGVRRLRCYGDSNRIVDCASARRRA